MLLLEMARVMLIIEAIIFISIMLIITDANNDARRYIGW
jgi:hypothetical protein